ncbi:hypothetical protein PPERSA_10000 [Pseudocohnilembus persalinus]|uniref:Uncharacterized protein n=1 Tax=Pseudocohnilembus persalinus TaxID=266149 RepID=A0A0V0QJA7_PSEPJ|nr:hypothetical protein PPERSA_10000 [Pseudocohnilembus persalinus]|eukprot:KRX02383.1 hypothetical protein PPERSA_10000 [Pseudocohnilembus persalinus]
MQQLHLPLLSPQNKQISSNFSSQDTRNSILNSLTERKSPKNIFNENKTGQLERKSKYFTNLIVKQSEDQQSETKNIISRQEKIENELKMKNQILACDLRR